MYSLSIWFHIILLDVFYYEIDNGIIITKRIVYSSENKIKRQGLRQHKLPLARLVSPKLISQGEQLTREVSNRGQDYDRNLSIRSNRGQDYNRNPPIRSNRDFPTKSISDPSHRSINKIGGRFIPINKDKPLIIIISYTCQLLFLLHQRNLPWFFFLLDGLDDICHNCWSSLGYLCYINYYIDSSMEGLDLIFWLIFLISPRSVILRNITLILSLIIPSPSLWLIIWSKHSMDLVPGNGYLNSKLNSSYLLFLSLWLNNIANNLKK